MGWRNTDNDAFGSIIICQCVSLCLSFSLSLSLSLSRSLCLALSVSLSLVFVWFGDYSPDTDSSVEIVDFEEFWKNKKIKNTGRIAGSHVCSWGLFFRMFFYVFLILAFEAMQACVWLLVCKQEELILTPFKVVLSKKYLTHIRENKNSSN